MSEPLGPPPAPSLGHGIGVIFRMQTRRLVRGRKLRLGLVSVALVLFAVVAARYAGASGEVGPDRAAELAAAAVRDGIDWGFFHLLVFLIPFLFNAHAIGEEVESRTFTYLSSRPTGRFAITVGKWAAGALFGVALVVGATLVLHVAAYATEPSALVEELGGTPMYELALELERVMDEKVGHKGICPNVDFFSGLLYQKLEIPTDLFTPIFAIARVSGYMAHWLEQMPDNRIFRPTQVYTGAREAEYVPMSDRR